MHPSHPGSQVAAGTGGQDVTAEPSTELSTNMPGAPIPYIGSTFPALVRHMDPGTKQASLLACKLLRSLCLASGPRLTVHCRDSQTATIQAYMRSSNNIHLLYRCCGSAACGHKLQCLLRSVPTCHVLKLTLVEHVVADLPPPWIAELCSHLTHLSLTRCNIRATTDSTDSPTILGLQRASSLPTLPGTTIAGIATASPTKLSIPSSITSLELVYTPWTREAVLGSPQVALFEQLTSLTVTYPTSNELSELCQHAARLETLRLVSTQHSYPTQPGTSGTMSIPDWLEHMNRATLTTLAVGGLYCKLSSPDMDLLLQCPGLRNLTIPTLNLATSLTHAPCQLKRLCFTPSKSLTFNVSNLVDLPLGAGMQLSVRSSDEVRLHLPFTAASFEQMMHSATERAHGCGGIDWDVPVVVLDYVECGNARQMEACLPLLSGGPGHADVTNLRFQGVDSFDPQLVKGIHDSLGGCLQQLTVVQCRLHRDVWKALLPGLPALTHLTLVNVCTPCSMAKAHILNLCQSVKRHRTESQPPLHVKVLFKRSGVDISDWQQAITKQLVTGTGVRLKILMPGGTFNSGHEVWGAAPDHRGGLIPLTRADKAWNVLRGVARACGLNMD